MCVCVWGERGEQEDLKVHMWEVWTDTHGCTVKMGKHTNKHRDRKPIDKQTDRQTDRQTATDMQADDGQVNTPLLMVQLFVVLGGGGISNSRTRIGPPAGRYALRSTSSSSPPLHSPFTPSPTLLSPPVNQVIAC